VAVGRSAILGAPVGLLLSGVLAVLRDGLQKNTERRSSSSR
jgi:hypothetical protein